MSNYEFLQMDSSDDFGASNMVVDPSAQKHSSTFFVPLSKVMKVYCNYSLLDLIS